MDFYRIRRHLMNYQGIHQSHNKTIGSVIKHYRKEQNLTLEDASTNICSISYLCKVENNQLLPSIQIKEELIKRLNISEEIFEQNYCFKWIDEIIFNNSVSESVYKQNVNKYDYKAKLVKYAYHTLNLQDLNKSMESYLDLSNYIEHFKAEEIILFFFLILSNFYNSGNYLGLLKIYNEVNNIPIDSKTLTYCKVIKVKTLYKLNKINEANYLIDSLYKELITLNKIELFIKIKNFEYAQKARLIDTSKLNEELQILADNPSYEIDYIWFCHFYYYQKDFTKALKYIKRIYRKKEYFHTMYLITLDKLKLKDELNNVLFNSSNDLMCENYSIVKNYITTKNFKNDKTTFLRNTLIHAKNYIQEVEIANYLSSESIKSFKSIHHYKDMVKILENENKHLKESLSLII